MLALVTSCHNDFVFCSHSFSNYRLQCCILTCASLFKGIPLYLVTAEGLENGARAHDKSACGLEPHLVSEDSGNRKEQKVSMEGPVHFRISGLALQGSLPRGCRGIMGCACFRLYSPSSRS